MLTDVFQMLLVIFVGEMSHHCLKVCDIHPDGHLFPDSTQRAALRVAGRYFMSESAKHLPLEQ